MSWIKAADPLALLAIEAGKVGTPVEQVGATASVNLDIPQRSVKIGEPVPIVFARRRDGNGGILVSPGATEARFENNTSNAVTAYYHLVVSEGRIGDIPVKDVFQRACRVGSHTQTYNRRAGTWLPGNYIVQRSGYELPEASAFCGSIGLYPGISTLSFQTGAIPDGFDQWNRQVHLFIRNGMEVQRLVEEDEGSSDNFADLALWMLRNSERVPDALIDEDGLADAAEFLDANGFSCNCEIKQARNYSDLLAEWAPYFLLRESSNGGKKGLRPLLPVTTAGLINTDPVTWEYIFTEQTILPGSFEINYSSLADRLPFVAQMIWRQQPEMEPGIIRTAEVRYAGTAESGPYEAHDLSAFCTSEDHAVKAGAYLLSKRVRSTHTIRFVAKPEQHSQIVSEGDLIRVKLQRQSSNAAPSVHDYLYQVEKITKTLAGDIGYECSYFPVDNEGRSLIAQDVVNAVGAGIVLENAKTGPSCDTNSATDSTIPTEEFTVPEDFSASDFEVDMPSAGGAVSGGGGGSGPSDDSENPTDDQDKQDPYQDWPAGYPRPDGEFWPADLPTNTDPQQGPYVEPVPVEIPSLPPGETGYWTASGSSGAFQTLTYNPNDYSCNVTGSGTIDAFSNTNLGTKIPTGLFTVWDLPAPCGFRSYTRHYTYYDTSTSQNGSGTIGWQSGGVTADGLKITSVQIISFGIFITS